jgi:SNF2 family DNA or RNA helicase
MGFMSVLYGVTVKEQGNKINITGIPQTTFMKDIKNQWGTTKLKNMFQLQFHFGRGQLMSFHKFFLPDFLYVINQLPNRRAYQLVTELIYENTYLKKLNEPIQENINLTTIQNELQLELKEYQLEFVKNYDRLKQRYSLKGYLLAFDTGVGKTVTAIALMTALNKEKIIVLTPNNVVYEFAGEINKFCKTPQKIWTKEKPISNAKWFIINYESMPKLLSLKELKSGNIGIIIDEIHYFRSANAERVKYAEMIAKYTQSVDILTMSGTPIKQAPAELIPLLKLLDPYFDEEAEQIFKKAFGVNTMQLADIVRHRLGMMMYRKTKEEVLDLPEKHEENIMVKIPNGENYTLKKVQQEVKKFVEERKKYYDQSTKQFEQDYLAGLKYFTSTSQFNKSDYNKYLNIVEAIKKKKYGSWEEKGRLMKEANFYEKTVILPTLPSELKNRFKKAKSVYKYVDMVMLGEVIGNLLTRLRAAMYSEMFKHGPIKDIIQKAIKKTIIFTTFTDVVEAAAKSARDDWGMNPSIIYGKTSKDTPAILKEFKQNPNKNPLICTMQTMATGVTVVEANTVIFVGQGFRSVDKKQAYSRVYRIGQTDDVYIYTLILDTGSEPNLSTRLEDIVSWSQQMFDAVVGDVDIDLQKVVGTESIHDDFIMDMLKFDNTSNEQTLLSSTSVVHEFLFKK